MLDFQRFRRLWATLLLIVHWWLVLTYMVTHINKRKHIAVLQRGKVILVSENVAWLIITACYVSREWAVTRPAGYPLYDASPFVNLASAIWPGIGAVVSFTRAYTVLVKFTKLPAACRLVEVRTTQGQLAFAFLAFIITVVYWVTLETYGRHLCFHICHNPNVIFQAHYLLAAPYNIIYNGFLNATAKKCAEVGATAETAGILRELERLGKFLSVTMVSQVIFIIIMDNGFIPYNTAVQFFLFNFCMMQMFGLWTVLNLEPSIRHGYCPFPQLVRWLGPRLGVLPEELLEYDQDDCETAEDEPCGQAQVEEPIPTPSPSPPSPPPLSLYALAAHPIPFVWPWGRKNVAPTPEPLRQGSFKRNRNRIDEGSSVSFGSDSFSEHGEDGGGLTNARGSARRRQSSSSSNKSSAGITEADMKALLQSFRWEMLLADQAKLEELWVLGRTILCEEAVRCMVHITHLRCLGNSAEDKELVRKIYRTIITEHLGAAATMPVDISPWLRNDLLRVLEVSARRKVIFRDDRIDTLKALQLLADTLAPRANSVFRKFFVQAYGMGRTPGQSKRKFSLMIQPGAADQLAAKFSPRGQGVPTEPLTGRQTPRIQGGNELARVGSNPKILESRVSRTQNEACQRPMAQGGGA